jgi:hypothetical protein
MTSAQDDLYEQTQQQASELGENAPQFDFDYMSALFKSDPAKFEQESSELMERTIDYWTDDLEKRARLKAMMFRNNMNMRKIKEPLVRAAKSYDVMMASFEQLRTALVENNLDLDVPPPIDNVVKFTK